MTPSAFAQVAKSAGSSDYWTHVGLVQMQTMGFYEGYNAAAPADQKLNFMQAYSLSVRLFPFGFFFFFFFFGFFPPPKKNRFPSLSPLVTCSVLPASL